MGIRLRSATKRPATKNPSRRATRDARLLEQIQIRRRGSRGTYGTPCLHRTCGPRACGSVANVSRVCSSSPGLEGVSRRLHPHLGGHARSRGGAECLDRPRHRRAGADTSAQRARADGPGYDASAMPAATSSSLRSRLPVRGRRRPALDVVGRGLLRRHVRRPVLRRSNASSSIGSRCARRAPRVVRLRRGLDLRRRHSRMTSRRSPSNESGLPRSAGPARNLVSIDAACGAAAIPGLHHVMTGEQDRSDTCPRKPR